MKRIVPFILLFISVNCFGQSSWIRVNQIGYLENDIKVAVWISKENKTIDQFSLIDSDTKKTIYTGDTKKSGIYGAFASTYRLDFSAVTKPGTYYVQVNDTQSPAFKIGNNVYDNATDIPLKYMRQQRCGYNPFLKDSCHVKDAISVGDPEEKRNGKYYNTTGGWHDASDYLQYVATSANAVYQMLFAYSQFPDVFGDKYQANGDEGTNGIPDIIDEAKWGLDWLVKMNPDKDTYFNQLADDRDHAGFILPPDQKVDYGWGAGKERPVYFCSPKPQGLFKYKNRSTGLASTMGKYASAFSLGSKVMEKFYPEFSKLLLEKATDAYQNGVKNPGVSQTAPGGAPYFYEEDNWSDDMELAALELFSVYGKYEYLIQGVNYGRLEPATPWMGADSARHYQWYPFINIGHYKLANQNKNQRAGQEFIRNMRSGLQRVKDRAQDNAFMNGIPFIWCSNNLTVGFITQCRLYHELTGDSSFLEIENAMRDWLLGCNPWGTSMIVDYPSNGDSPADPHSAFTHLGKMPITGGLIDGPIYASIYNSLIGVYLSEDDEYAPFQSKEVVYHDDFADYSTNEPTMDGTASLSYYFGYLSSYAQRKQNKECAITHGDKNKKQLSLVFTGHEFADGTNTISKVLKKNKVKGSFFLTGDFYRAFPNQALMLQKEGHYMAPHSDKHLLYADWNKRDSTLLSRSQFEKDVKDNYTTMTQIGLKIEGPQYFMPAYEWYNNDICDWTKAMGIKLVNFTPGTFTNADYTTPDMKNYRSSQNIIDKVLEQELMNGLNGSILLIHIGTHPLRTDKFYNSMDKLIIELKKRGYDIVRIDKLLDQAN